MSYLVERWVTEKIITPEQATRVLRTLRPDVETVASPRPPEPRGSLVVEALGYVGGAIVVAASMLIAARYWGDLAGAWRLLVLGLATLALLGGGSASPAATSDVAARLRAALWLGSTAAASGGLSVLAVDLLDLQGKDVTALVASGTAAYAAALWFMGRDPLQQVAMMVALAMTASSLIALADVPDAVPGLGAWGVGGAWAVLGWARVLRPSWLGLALGAATATVGAMMTASSDPGTVLTLVTVLAVIGTAMTLRHLLLLGVGTVGLLVNLPAALTRWFPDSTAAPYALLVTGLFIVLAAVQIGRHPHGQDPERRQRQRSDP